MALLRGCRKYLIQPVGAYRVCNITGRRSCVCACFFIIDLVLTCVHQWHSISNGLHPKLPMIVYLSTPSFTSFGGDDHYPICTFCSIYCGGCSIFQYFYGSYL